MSVAKFPVRGQIQAAMSTPSQILARIRSWHEFERALGPLGTKEKGDAFELLTKCFLKIEPKYATHLSNVWLLADVPEAVRRHLHLPNQDEGIDLIAETREGDYWAIQCKYHAEHDSSVTRRDLSTFTDLAFGICQNVSFALVCTTSERLSRKLSLYGNRIGFCTSETWQGLTEGFFDALSTSICGERPQLIPLSPRPHQQRAIQNALGHFAGLGKARGKLILPCGTGKSLTGYWISQKLEAKRILIAVPSLALIRQTLEVWTREMLANGESVKWTCVCSDDSLTDIQTDDIEMLAQDLGVDVHTDPDEIARILRSTDRAKIVVFSTYQSGPAITLAANMADFTFDLGIFDEAHKTVGKHGNLFTHLLFDENIKIRKRLFMTATERRYRGRSDSIASMDDAGLYGDTFELLSFKEAVETKPPILSDYQIVTIRVLRSEVEEMIRSNVIVNLGQSEQPIDIEAEMLACALALRKAMKRKPIKHAVSFHSTITRAKAFKDIQERIGVTWPEYGQVDVFHVSGGTPTSVRSRTIREFAESERSIITNARCLTEGVDVPNIDCVLFADPKRSTVDIVQAVGRALRPAKGKELGYVVMPIIIDDLTEESVGTDTNAFEDVITVLRALGANDERIIEYFRGVSSGKQHSGRREVVEIDVTEGTQIDAEEFIQSIELQFWSRLAKLSWRPYEEAREFVRKLGLRREPEWRAYCSGQFADKQKRPPDIPSNPNLAYQNRGWVSWGEWFGTGSIATYLRQYRSFEEAREFARSLNLAGQSEWYAFCRGELPEKENKPEDIPQSPGKVYKESGWIGYGDWLGTGAIAPTKREWRSFVAAREFARSLGLKNNAEWRAYCAGELPEAGTRPDDIPSNPNGAYRDSGWQSWSDWLGSDYISTWHREFRPFEEAREFARTLGLRNNAEWRVFCAGGMPQKGFLPKDISQSPNRTYRNLGWQGMGDWLGTGAVSPSKRSWRPFPEARVFACSLGLSGRDEWKAYCRGELPEKGNLPDDIPRNPNRIYTEKGWESWGDWLGTGTVAAQLRQYRPFEEARSFVQSLGLTGQIEWRTYCKGGFPGKGSLPGDIPSAPHQVYREKGWSGYGDWLGTGNVANNLRSYRPFEEARSFAQSLGLTGQRAWRAYCKGEFPNKGCLPEDIPSAPHQVYTGKGWNGYGDWLGTGNVHTSYRQFLPFEEARYFAISLGLRNQGEWRAYCRGELPEKGEKPDDIPQSPHRTYKNSGWKGYGDWLGTGFIAPILRVHRSFNEARAFVRSLNLRNKADWEAFCAGKMPEKGRLPTDIPSNPQKTYRESGWNGLGDWLGTGTVATWQREYQSFEDARNFVRSLGFRSKEEWSAFCAGKLPSKGKLPPTIPVACDAVYKNAGWISWPNWLGNG